MFIWFFSCSNYRSIEKKPQKTTLYICDPYGVIVQMTKLISISLSLPSFVIDWFKPRNMAYVLSTCIMVKRNAQNTMIDFQASGIMKVHAHDKCLDKTNFVTLMISCSEILQNLKLCRTINSTKEKKKVWDFDIKLNLIINDCFWICGFVKYYTIPYAPSFYTWLNFEYKRFSYHCLLCFCFALFYFFNLLLNILSRTCTKLSLAGGAIYWSVQQGVWGTPEEGHVAMKRLTEAIAPSQEPVKNVVTVSGFTFGISFSYHAAHCVSRSMYVFRGRLKRRKLEIRYYFWKKPDFLKTESCL